MRLLVRLTTLELPAAKKANSATGWVVIGLVSLILAFGRIFFWETNYPERLVTCKLHKPVKRTMKHGYYSHLSQTPCSSCRRLLAITLPSAFRRRSVIVVALLQLSTRIHLPAVLPEVVGGSIEPRHALVDLRSHLRQSNCAGQVVRLTTKLNTPLRRPRRQHFGFHTKMCYCRGRYPRVSTEGLGENGIGLKRIEEAVTLRSQILERIESAAPDRCRTASSCPNLRCGWWRLRRSRAHWRN